MALTSELRQKAGDAALQMIMAGEARAAASAKPAGRLPLQAEQTAPAKVDVSACTDLLARASKGMVLLDTHYRQLEGYARDRETWTNGEVRRLELEAARAEQAAADFDRKTREIEARIGAEQRRIASADQAAETHKRNLALLQAQVSAAFGPDSELARALSDFGAD